jgi:hypothetical protein
MNCLNERRLLALHTGEGGTDADRRHVAECAACDARLRTLTRDLARIDAVLREAPHRLPAPRIRAWRLAPLALAAMLALAVLVHRHRQAEVRAADDALALADEVADALVADVALDDEGEESADASTCAWGDPLLGVGCDEPADMQIAWR